MGVSPLSLVPEVTARGVFSSALLPSWFVPFSAPARQDSPRSESWDMWLLPLRGGPVPCQAPTSRSVFQR